MPNTQQWEPEKPIQILAYGKPKVGKTWGALTFPRPNVIDFDGGIDTARNPEFVAKYGLKSIEYFQPRERGLNAKGVPMSHNAFDDACRYFDEWMRPGKRDQFDTWVVDSGTSAANAAMNKAIILLGTSGFAAASKTHKQALEYGLIAPKQQDFGSERSMIEQFVRMIKESGKHFVFICHEKEKLDETGKMILEIAPLLTGKGVAAVCAMFHEIYRVKAIGSVPSIQRTILTQPSELSIAGSRYGVKSGIKFDYESISAELNAIRAAQSAMSKTPVKESPLTGAPSAASVPAKTAV